MFKSKGMTKTGVVIAVIVLVVAVAAGLLFSFNPELFQGKIFSMRKITPAATKNSARTVECPPGSLDLAMDSAYISSDDPTAIGVDDKNYYNVTFGVKNVGKVDTRPLKLTFLNVKEYTNFVNTGSLGDTETIYTAPETITLKSGEMKPFTASLTSMDKKDMSWKKYVFLVKDADAEGVGECNYLNNIKTDTVTGKGGTSVVTKLFSIINRAFLWTPYKDSESDNLFANKFVTYMPTYAGKTTSVLKVCNKTLDSATLSKYFDTNSVSYDYVNWTEVRAISRSKDQYYYTDIPAYDDASCTTYSDDTNYFPSDWFPTFWFQSFDIDDIDAIYNSTEGKTFFIEYMAVNPYSRANTTVGYSDLLYFHPYYDLTGKKIDFDYSKLKKAPISPLVKKVLDRK